MKKKLICVLLCAFTILATLIVKAPSVLNSSYNSDGSLWDSRFVSSSFHHFSNNTKGFMQLLFICIILFVIRIAFGDKDFRNNVTDHYRGYKDITLEDLQRCLPDKTIEQVKEDAFACFVNIQEAWMNFDYDALREYCTDELYNTYVSQLETLKLKNGQNIMSDYQNLDMKITNITSENNVVSLIVYAEIRFHDYVINMKTNEVIRGTKERLMTNHYLMTFVIKKSDAKSLKNCPSCGAPFEHNASGVCEYCGSTIIKESDALVLSKKTTINR